MQGGDRVDFVAVVDQVIALRRECGRLTYRPLPCHGHGMQRTERPARTRASRAIASRWMPQDTASSGAAVGLSTEPHRSRSLGKAVA